MRLEKHSKYGDEVQRYVFDIPEMPKELYSELDEQVKRGIPNRASRSQEEDREWQLAYQHNLRQALFHLAKTCELKTLCCDIQNARLWVDWCGILWDPRGCITLVELPYFSRLNAPIHARQVHSILTRASLPISAMVTQLLVGMTLSSELRDFIHAKNCRVVALGWSGIDTDERFPEIVGGEHSMLHLAEDPFAPNALFAFAGHR